MNVLLLVRLCRRIRAHRAMGIGFVFGMLLVSILGNAVCFYACDGSELGIGMGDALWYSTISITTIAHSSGTSAVPVSASFMTFRPPRPQAIIHEHSRAQWPGQETGPC